MSYLAGCCGENDPVAPEYGMPVATLRLGGSVATEVGENPIPGLEVRLAGVDTVLTDTQGDWSMTSWNANPLEVVQQNLIFVDVDGVANLGAFMSREHDLDPANIGQDGAYVELGIQTRMSDEIAEYGPPPATPKTQS